MQLYPYLKILHFFICIDILPWYVAKIKYIQPTFFFIIRQSDASCTFLRHKRHLNLCLFTAECHTFGILTLACPAAANSDMVCLAFTVFIVYAVACLTFYFNISLRMHHGISGRITLSFPETGTARSLRIFCILSSYCNISLTAVPVFIIVTICGGTF